MRVVIPVKWEASLSKDVAGYKVHWGPQGKKPVGVVAVAGARTSLQLSIDVPTKKVYVVSVSAYDVAGNESTHTQLTSVYVG